MARDNLSDAKVRSAKPGAKPYKLYDGGGLFLLVPNGSRYWRLKYRIAAKEKLLAIGVYPDVSLSEARAKALGARGLIRDGVDPVVERRRHRAGQALPQRKSSRPSPTSGSPREPTLGLRAIVWPFTRLWPRTSTRTLGPCRSDRSRSRSCGRRSCIWRSAGPWRSAQGADVGVTGVPVRYCDRAGGD